jgi:hypothetical protein
MATLLLAGSEVSTVFELLGRTENDMTYALGFGLARSVALRSAFLERLAIDPAHHDITVRLQQHGPTGGFTDIEVSDGTSFHVIVEAKRGWWLPGPAQLALYERRFDEAATMARRLVVLTQWGAESAARHEVEKMGLREQCEILGWSDALALLTSARRFESMAGRRWLDELERYLREVTDMRDIDSNSVYVVSLNHFRPQGWPYDFMEVVSDLGRYFYPANGKGWPKEPPTTSLPGTEVGCSPSTMSTTTSSSPISRMLCRCTRPRTNLTTC